MKFDYSIAILGTVSAGKSTLLNGIFAKNFSDMNIRRTTMTPQMYQLSNTSREDNYQQIVNQNVSLNKEYQKEIWNGEEIVIHDVNFPSNFIKNHPNINFRIYDIPGLNDQTTKDIYMGWVDKNFEIFDLAILVVDISSGFNTSDEVSVLNLIFKKMVDQPHVNLMILVNKCDEMVFDNGDFMIDEERQEIYQEQVIPTIIDTASKWNLNTDRIYTQKFCSRNLFIYRTIILNNFEEIRTFLDDKHLNEMMITEVGRNRWLKMTSTQKEKKILEMLNELREDKECYENNMIHCGYKMFCEKINSIVYDNKTAVLYCNNLMTKVLYDTTPLETLIKYSQDISEVHFSNELKEFMISSIRNFVAESHFKTFKDEEDVHKFHTNLKEAIRFENILNSFPFMYQKKIITRTLLKQFYSILLDYVKDVRCDQNYFQSYFNYYIEICSEKNIDIDYSILTIFLEHHSGTLLEMNKKFFRWFYEINPEMYQDNIMTFFYEYIDNVVDEFGLIGKSVIEKETELYELYKFSFLLERLKEDNLRIYVLQAIDTLKKYSVELTKKFLRESNKTESGVIYFFEWLLSSPQKFLEEVDEFFTDDDSEENIITDGDSSDEETSEESVAILISKKKH